MYILKLLSSLIFLPTPTYYQCSFIRARLEGLEYAILFSAVANSKRVITFRTNLSKQHNLIFDWGKMWILIDDLADEHPDLITQVELKTILLGKNQKSYSHPLIKDLMVVAQKINAYLINHPYQRQYLDYSARCLECSSLEKGGYFSLSLVYLLNPIKLTDAQAQAIIIGGTWGQLIDDFADDSRISNKELIKESNIFKDKIRQLLKREDVIIPVNNDLIVLAKLTRLPVFKVIFSLLNH